MNFKTNFSKITLLGKEVVKIYFENKVVEFVPPNIRTYYTDLDFLEFLFIIKTSKDDLKKYFNFNKFIIENNYETFLFILKEYKTQELLKYFKHFFPNIEYINSSLVVDEKPLVAEEYDILIEFLLVCSLEKDFKTFISKIDPTTQTVEDKPLTEMQKKLKEQEEKLKKIKNKKKESKEKPSNSKITIDQIVIAILSEFPSLKLEDIYDMDLITFFDFWNYVAKITDNKIQIVAAGNGLIKEFTYFIN